MSPVPLQAGAADNSCDLQGSPGGKHVHHSSPTTHTHTADGEAEQLTCPRMSPVQRGRARTGARGSQGLYDRSYRAGRALERRKESPWSILAGLSLQSSGHGERGSRWLGVEEGIGGLGAHRVEGPGDPRVQEQKLQNTGRRPRPGGPSISLFLNPTAAKHALTWYNHLIIAITWYDLTTLPAYYSARKYRKRFNYASCNPCMKESLSTVVNLKRLFLLR